MNESETKGCGAAMLLIFFLVVSVLFVPVYRASGETITATVVKTVVDDGNTFFVLQQEDQPTEIFENEDSFSFWKFNSNDILMQLEVGRTYNFEVAGWRVPFLSWFRNIIEVTPASGTGI